MKEILNKNDYLIIKSFDSSDFYEMQDDITKDMNTIFASYEYYNDNYNDHDALDTLQKNADDFFLKSDANGKVYILYMRHDLHNQLMPVGVALFSDSNMEKAKHLEYISIHSEFSGCGYGEELLKQCAIDINKNGYDKITSIVNKNNHASERMHYSFSNSNNIDVAVSDIGGRYEYIFDISHIINKHPNGEPPQDEHTL